eukprot:446749-Prorocentrum_minimum.AAC.1
MGAPLFSPQLELLVSQDAQQRQRLNLKSRTLHIRADAAQWECHFQIELTKAAVEEGDMQAAFAAVTQVPAHTV